MTTWEDGLAVSYKTKHTYHVIQQSCSLVSTERSKKLMSTKNLHMEFYSSFIPNCQNLESIKMSFSR